MSVRIAKMEISENTKDCQNLNSPTLLRVYGNWYNHLGKLYINSLYSTKSILPEIKNVTDIESITNLPWDIVEPYSEYFRKSQPRVLINIDWNKLKEYTNKVYYWQSDLYNQLLINKYDDGTQKVDYYSRPLLEPEKFAKELSSVQSEIKARSQNRPYKTCARDDHDFCRLIRKSGISMEYIDSDSLIFIWNTHTMLNNETYDEWIIVPCSGEKINRRSYHKFHTLLWNAKSEFEEFFWEETKETLSSQANDEVRQSEESSRNTSAVSEDGINELKELLYEIDKPLQNALDYYGALARDQDGKDDLFAKGVKKKYEKLVNLFKVRERVLKYTNQKQHTLKETESNKTLLEKVRKDIDSIN